MFEYKHFTAKLGEELQRQLSHFGKDGWRLCTCEPIRTRVGDVEVAEKVLVVMDRFVPQEEPEKDQGQGDAPGAIACRS